jgi:uncharacterized membrane protein
MIHRFPEQFPHQHAHFAGGFVPGILTLLLLAVLVGLAVWAIIGMRRRPPAGTVAPPAPRAEDVAVREARMRYARGEITREQFLEISSDLQAAALPDS